MKEEYLSELKYRKIPFDNKKQSIFILLIRLFGDMKDSTSSITFVESNVKLYKESYLLDFDKIKTTSSFNQLNLKIAECEPSVFDIYSKFDGNILEFIPFISRKELLTEFNWLHILLKDSNGKTYNLLMEIEFRSDYTDVNYRAEGLIYIAALNISWIYDSFNKTNDFRLIFGPDEIDVSLIDSLSNDKNCTYLSNKKLVLDGSTKDEYLYEIECM